MPEKTHDGKEPGETLIPLYFEETKGIMGGLAGYARNIRKHSFLLRKLILVDIVVSFKRSFIGLSWLVITPVLSVFVWILLHGAGIIEPGKTDIPYPAYVLLSTSIWGFFQGAYHITSNVITNSGRFMVSAKFPHEVLIVQQVVVHAINFIIPFVINLIVLILYGIKFSWIALLFPVTLIPLLLLGTGLGLLVALMRVVAVDFSRLADQCINFLMFLTPIVYAPKISLTWLADIVRYNPLTYLVGFSRDLLTRGTLYEPNLYFLFSLLSLVSFVICLRIFMKLEGRLLERLINV
jgi:lipopolysaccharide transport system permease protein